MANLGKSRGGLVRLDLVQYVYTAVYTAGTHRTFKGGGDVTTDKFEKMSALDLDLDLDLQLCRSCCVYCAIVQNLIRRLRISNIY